MFGPFRFPAWTENGAPRILRLRSAASKDGCAGQYQDVRSGCPPMDEYRTAAPAGPAGRLPANAAASARVPWRHRSLTCPSDRSADRPVSGVFCTWRAGCRSRCAVRHAKGCDAGSGQFRRDRSAGPGQTGSDTLQCWSPRFARMAARDHQGSAHLARHILREIHNLDVEGGVSGINHGVTMQML